MAELNCPRCGAALVKKSCRDRIGFACPEGHGTAMTLGAVRALCGSRRLIDFLWYRSGTEDAQDGAPCPVCRRPMRQVTLDVAGRELELDICRRCQEVWFDPHELEALPPPPSPEVLPQKAREAIALAQVERMGEEHDRASSPFAGAGDLDNPLKYLAALLGLPVEADAPPLRRLPLATWGLMLICIAVFALTFGELDFWAKEWGFIPAAAARKGGATWLTSMFLHGGLAHLFGNMYFLWIFGDNVEDELGTRRYLGFVLLAGLAATGLFLLLRPNTTLPCVGASGFISGVIALYAVLYPKVEIVMRFYWRLIALPAWLLFVFWLGIQLVMACMTHHAPGGGVAYAAHVGGAIPGLLCGMAMRVFRERRSAYDGRSRSMNSIADRLYRP